MLAIKQPKIYKSGAALVAEALKDSSVTNIFGYPGASVLSLYNELADTPEITHCLCRHEQACVHAAEGYARASGKPGIVLVTSGPGATNTVTGIANAYADSVPLVIIAGAANKSTGKVFQNVDFISMVQPVVKRIYNPQRTDNIYEIIKEAVCCASSGKQAPVLVQLTRSVLEYEYEQTNYKSNLSNNLSTENINITELVSAINSASCPLFIIGGGCKDSFYEVSDLIKETRIPAVTTLMGVGNISADTENCLGMIGVNGTAAANKKIEETDLIIALGVAFSDRTTCKTGMFAGGTPVININIDKNIHNNVNIIKEINCDCRIIIAALKNKINKRISPLHADKPEKTYEQAAKMQTEDVLSLINEFTKPLKPVIITDVGQHQMLAAKCFKFYAPKRFITSGGMGTMGFGLPASCGVHFACPDSYIINITGDGSFQMNLQELATVNEYKIPVKIFVMNNGYLGMIRQMQEKFFCGKYYQSKMHNPDFIKLAEGFGIKGYRVSDIKSLQNILPIVFKTTEPVIVDCITNEFENV